MEWRDRQGNPVPGEAGQDRLLEFLYGSVPGRWIVSLMVRPWVSKAAGALMDSGISRLAIKPFLKNSSIDMSQFENRAFRSFNDFFTRQVREGVRPIDREQPKFSYFGNIRQGRSTSLAAIADSLRELSENDILDVWSNQETGQEVEELRAHPNLRFHGAAPYEEVVRRMGESDVVVIVEGFRPDHVNNTRYSLSTKAADCLACGAQILVYGSGGCGVIEYMASTGAAMVCTEPEQLTDAIRRLLEDEAFQQKAYGNAEQISRERHDLEVSLATVRNVLEKAVREYGKTT
jgi:glycosyltransferase involved in cell wall biosynthesis